MGVGISLSAPGGGEGRGEVGARSDEAADAGDDRRASRLRSNELIVQRLPRDRGCPPPLPNPLRPRRGGILAVLATLLALLAPVRAHAALLDRLLPWVSSSIRTTGLSIHWGGTLTADKIELLDTAGAYATFDGVKIVWSPLALIHGNIMIDSLSADAGDVARLPASSGKSSGGGLPSKLEVKALAVSRLTLEKPLAGTAATLHITGSGARNGANDMHATLTAERLDGGGTYDAKASLTASGLDVDVSAKEPAGGLIETAAGLPDLGGIDLTAAVTGPEIALATQVSLAAGKLTAAVKGQVDLPGRTLALQASANAPAMAPRPDVSWQSVALSADIHGPFATPDVKAALHATGLHAAGGGADAVTLDGNGNAGDVRLSGQLDGVTVPGKQPDLLAAAPLRLEAEAKLSEPGRPVTFALHHPLLEASGTAQLDTEQGRLDVTLPDLAPLAADAGEDIAGRAALHLTRRSRPARRSGSRSERNARDHRRQGAGSGAGRSRRDHRGGGAGARRTR